MLLGWVSDGKHETEQKSEDAAGEKPVEKVVKQVTEDQTHNRSQWNEPDQMLPTRGQQVTQHLTLLCHHQSLR